MPANKRKNTNVTEELYSESNSSDSDEEEEGVHPDAYSGNEVVHVDFMGRSPLDPDLYGIAQLLSRLFLKAHINYMRLAELIIAQNYVGNVIAQCEPDGPDSDSDDMCEDDTIFGITTVVNITAKKDDDSIDQLRSYIMERAEKHATDAVLKHFREVLNNDANHVGFLINERFINIPVTISEPLLDNLLSEIETAKQKKMNFNFVHILMILKLYRKEAAKGKPAEDTYSNGEEEVFAENAVTSFEYSVIGECDSGMSGNWLEGDATLTPYRKVLLFDAEQLPHLVDQIKKTING